jgi:hypothetical protein
MKAISLGGKAEILRDGKGFCHLKFPWATKPKALLHVGTTRVSRAVPRIFVIMGN